jgi:hypothetical protein
MSNFLTTSNADQLAAWKADIANAEERIRNYESGAPLPDDIFPIKPITKEAAIEVERRLIAERQSGIDALEKMLP